MADIKGVYMVGSIARLTAESAMRLVATGMPKYLKRIPDGETGSRDQFTAFQRNIFTKTKMLRGAQDISEEGTTSADVEAEVAKLKSGDIETGYDTAAIESYAVFKKLRDEGVIPKGVKFQVCIPTMYNVLTPLVRPPFRSSVQPLYEQALYRAIRNIQDKIPHEDLSIQVDLAADTAHWEAIGTTPEERKAMNIDWMFPEALWGAGDQKEWFFDYTCRMLSHIDQDVELGIHNCYGDMYHAHWLDPKNLRAVADRGIGLLERSPHKIAYFHAPVAKSAMDHLGAYLSPLKDLWPHLKANGTELYLGVVHEHHPDMTDTMIKAATEFVPEFGVASECGWGRMDEGDMKSAMEISTKVAQPVM